MPKIEIEINNFKHVVACGAGEEHKLIEILNKFKQKVEEVACSNNIINEKTIYLIAAVMLADEACEQGLSLQKNSVLDATKEKEGLLVESMNAKLEDVIKRFECKQA